MPKLTKKQKDTVAAVEKFLSSCTGLTLGELRKMHLMELKNLWVYQGLPATDLIWAKDTGEEVVVIQLGLD